MDSRILTTVVLLVAAAAFAAVGFGIKSAPPVHAASIQLTAVIDEAQETSCDIGFGATGNGTLTLDTVTGDLSFNITFTPLSSEEVGAHIHGPAAPGSTASIVRALPAGSPKVGAVAPVLTPAEQADLLAGLYYVNIHSTNCPAGEIRGQIQILPPPPPVGGVSLDGGLSGLSGDSGGSLWMNGWLLAAAVAVFAATLGGAAWRARSGR